MSSDAVERLPQEQIDRIKEETLSAEMDSHGKDDNGQLDWPGMYAADCHMLLTALEAQRKENERLRANAPLATLAKKWANEYPISHRAAFQMWQRAEQILKTALEMQIVGVRTTGGFTRDLLERLAQVTLEEEEDGRE